jgi:hypothetical protein
VDEGHYTDALAANDYGRGHDRDPVADGRQLDQGLRCGTLQSHARPELRDFAGCIEPSTRPKFPAQQQNGLVGELRDINYLAAAELVGVRKHDHCVNRIQQSSVKAVVAGRHDG